MVALKMPDINTVLIAGNLTCDPSFRKTTNGTPVANFYMASNRKFKDNTGQWRENVCYVGVVAWYKLAESCYENLKRGSAIVVDGELQSRSWRNNDGTSRNVVEIKARRIQFLNRKPPQEGAFRSDEIGFVEDDTVDDSDVYDQKQNKGKKSQNSDSSANTSSEIKEKTQDDENKKKSDNDLEKYTFGYDNLQF